MKVLLIDNFDSYTHILSDTIWRHTKEKPIVIKNNSLDVLDIKYLEFDCIVISPGPGHPDNPKDFAVCREVFAHFPDTPVLGVCLGHQGMGSYFGLEVVKAPKEMHGKYSRILLEKSDLFKGLGNSLQVVRYHSLVLKDNPENKDVEVIARDEKDGLIMAIKIKDRPYFGVQFHPESIGTQNGQDIIGNFLSYAQNYQCPDEALNSKKFRVKEWLDAPELVHIFESLFQSDKKTVWLDSNSVGENSRFSILGNYSQSISSSEPGQYILQNENSKELVHGDPFVFLEEQLTKNHIEDTIFPFSGGYLGFCTYEAKKYFGYRDEDLEPLKVRMPEVFFVLLEQFLIHDRLSDKTYICTVSTDEKSHEEYCDHILKSWKERDGFDVSESDEEGVFLENLETVGLDASHSKEGYIKAIKKIFAYLKEGETYEVCLSNRYRIEHNIDDLSLYKLLRKINPAPFSAFISNGEFSILSSSPERFINLKRDRTIISEPIKGTRKRSTDPEENLRLIREMLSSPKDNAELLMITDLIRNDLAKVCEKNTIEVLELNKATEYATVIQQSSVIQGKLNAAYSAVDFFSNMYPGGSITGAPKKRTCEIISELEKCDRGIYTGSIGYFSFNKEMDFNIAIRTISKNENFLEFGSGGAIISDSDPEEEFSEIETKAAALLKAIKLSIQSNNVVIS